MEERTKTIAAVTILVSIVVLIIVVVGIMVSSKKVISPVPAEGSIKIIFVSPTPMAGLSASASAAPKIPSGR